MLTTCRSSNIDVPKLNQPSLYDLKSPAVNFQTFNPTGEAQAESSQDSVTANVKEDSSSSCPSSIPSRGSQQMPDRYLSSKY